MMQFGQNMLHRFSHHSRRYAGFDIYLDTSKLRDVSLEVEQICIDELTWCFDIPVWEKDGTDDWNLTPREVIEGKPDTSEHLRRVHDADLKYPILIIRHKDKWVILDGIHRLVKAYLAQHAE